MTPRRFAGCAISVPALCLLPGCSAASAGHVPTAAASGTLITVSANVCGSGWRHPSPGLWTFQVHNAGASSVDVSLTNAGTGGVYAEIEGVGPGTMRPMTVHVGSGACAFQCDNGSDGELTGPTTTIPGHAPGDPAVVPASVGQTLTAVTSERTYVERGLATTARQAAALLTDIQEGNLTAARSAWLTAHLSWERLGGGKRALKGIFDRAMAAAAVLLLSPVVLAIALIVRMSDGGPVLSRQTRVGQHGQTFQVWKFRTMVVDAEKQKTLLAVHNEGNGVLFKMRRDPRITKAGAWLRRYSLDELPQFFNVVLGDMSLVGPRPSLPEETAKYGRHMLRRLVVKPGITGLWQVSGRSDLSIEDSVRLDVRYVENWSLLLDLQILWKTGWAVTSGSGAY